MKIIWLSANKLGYELLKEAVKLKGFDLKAIVTLGDQAKTVMYDGVPAKKWGKFGVEVFEVGNANEDLEIFKRLSPDLIVMCGWRQILKEEILNIPGQGIIGFHPTLLPFGRGPAPIINTIMSGAKESGLTLFRVGRGLDDGDIIAQSRFKIAETDQAEDVYRKAIKAGKKLIKDSFPGVLAGTAPRRPQDVSQAVVFEKPEAGINRIDLEKDPIDRIYRKIKALSKPYRGAYIEKDGKRLIIWKAEIQAIK